MNIACALSSFRTAVTHGSPLSFVVFFQILIALLRPDIVDKPNRVPILDPHDISDSYDFIIIGAGSAGSVLANRLTENPKWTVLLLEAGEDEPYIADVPGMWHVLQKTDVDWGFKAEPSTKYCLGRKDNQCLYPRAKALGGSSMHNVMAYMRGNRKDYDQWRDLGNPGWGYEDVLPYFKKSENISIPELEDSPYHGKGGYLGVENWKKQDPLIDYFLNSVREAGHKIADLNGESQTGFMLTQGTLRNGLRCSTAKAFLRSASHRKNLYVSTGSMVEKILIDASTRTASGVEFSRLGEKFVVSARKEVILSAGAVQSPQMLMLSGIGPRKHLEEFGIPVIHDSPGVGENLQDHVEPDSMIYLMDSPLGSPVTTATDDTDSSGSSNLPIGTKLMSGTSLISITDAELFLNGSFDSQLYATDSPVQGYINSKYNSDADFPDLLIQFGSSGYISGETFASEYYSGVRKDVAESLIRNIVGKFSYSITPILTHPKSRGYIKLKDTNPNLAPEMVLNYFDDPHDMDVLVEGVKFAHKLSQSPAWKDLNPRPNPNSVPACAHLTHRSDAYWRCHIRHMTSIGYHLCGTCKMGPALDAMAVVDARLRVHGVKRLRVIDASIMPNVPAANINAPTIMIAEKAADLIKEDYRTAHCVAELPTFEKKPDQFVVNTEVHQSASDNPFQE